MRGQSATEVHERVPRDGETTTLAATEAMELLHYGLPDLSGMEAAVHTSGVAMQAAE
jgi:predicted component of type VI protein secretion system